MRLDLASAAQAPALAAAHAAAFETPWSAAEFAVLLTSPGIFALAVAEAEDVAGFILCRAVADEAEVLTLAVRPGQRRRGMGAALLAAGLEAARTAGARSIFLEVAADNDPALALYRRAGFATVAERPGYYSRPAGPIDALVMRLSP